MRTFGLSQYVAVSVTEVSDVDVNVDFTEAVLMLIIYQQRSPIDYCLLVLVIID